MNSGRGYLYPKIPNSNQWGAATYGASHKVFNAPPNGRVGAPTHPKMIFWNVLILWMRRAIFWVRWSPMHPKNAVLVLGDFMGASSYFWTRWTILGCVNVQRTLKLHFRIFWICGRVEGIFWMRQAIFWMRQSWNTSGNTFWIFMNLRVRWAE